MARIVVKHLPYNATEDDLRDLVGELGEIVAIDLPRDVITGHARPIGTIDLASEAEARDAVERLNHRNIRGHRIVVAHAEGVSLGSGEPMVEMEEPREDDESPAPRPHRPVREQGRDPGRWGH